MLEAFVLMTAQATAPPAASPPVKVTVPPVELLEFLGEWSEEDAKLIDGEAAGEQKPAAPDGRRRRGQRNTEGKSP
jgi:hypothetical protein